MVLLKNKAKDQKDFQNEKRKSDGVLTFQELR